MLAQAPFLLHDDRDYDTFLDDLRGVVWNDGRTWEQLAGDAKLSPSTVQKFASTETKKPHLLTIIKLAKALKLRVGLIQESAPLQDAEVNIRGKRRHIPRGPKRFKKK